MSSISGVYWVCLGFAGILLRGIQQEDTHLKGVYARTNPCASLSSTNASAPLFLDKCGSTLNGLQFKWVLGDYTHDNDT